MNIEKHPTHYNNIEISTHTFSQIQMVTQNDVNRKCIILYLILKTLLALCSSTTQTSINSITYMEDWLFTNPTNDKQHSVLYSAASAGQHNTIFKNIIKWKIKHTTQIHKWIWIWATSFSRFMWCCM